MLMNPELCFGEVKFNLRYGSLQGPSYPWLFVDPKTLEIIARAPDST
jgi:hypothetical protein